MYGQRFSVGQACDGNSFRDNGPKWRKKVARRDNWPKNGVFDAGYRRGIGLGGVKARPWLPTRNAASSLSIASLRASLLFARLGMVSLAQFGLLGVEGWFAPRISHRLHVLFEIALLAGGIRAAFAGVRLGLPALRLRGLYLGISTDDGGRDSGADKRLRFPQWRRRCARHFNRRAKMMERP